jgi:hypothetical protein
MGWSGKTGFVQMADTTRNTATGIFEPDGNLEDILEVTNWTADETSKITGYGHSESEGTEDVVAGTCAFRGTIEVKLQPDVHIRAGRVYDMQLTSPVVVLSGLGIMESVPIDVKIDGGDPVSATYRWRSKLKWTVADGDGDDGNNPS